MEHERKKVLVGMSGGIDSSAVCLMLQDEGYEVVGVTMRVWDLARQFTDAGQEYPDFIQDARALAARLGIVHYVADERTAFKDIVVRDFVDEYLAGRTPNPCVMCNPAFKFRVLVEWADKLGCDYIATGHYVRVKEEDGHYALYCGVDGKKDQSYFLWRLGQDVLSRCIFPLGAMRKEDVRGYLARKGFEMKARSGESMEICFIDKDYRDFLREQVPDLDWCVGEGKFVDVQGRVIGTHCGFPYFTVGQRKGLGIALGKPAYVLRLNARKNTVMLGDADDLDASHMLVSGMRMPEDGTWDDGSLSVRIRYRSRPIPCTVRRVKNLFPEEGGSEELGLVRFKEKASAVTPGQSAVFYVGDKMVGGAYIGSQRGLQAYLED
ncbi:tRNA 2-thiouridine(34) synthase MnmA [Paraprevotella xylaniphila]|uniref:tRNA 2-thiouridine(34) synthase MnmA n=1 Tax=Paraprevotella xylaniphila TaxID=454155 RepID=UPI0026DCAB7F|nr:tRNA 2-thiouridine(34) synthase MnmA [Paraprevotella xylaniphila]